MAPADGLFFIQIDAAFFIQIDAAFFTGDALQASDRLKQLNKAQRALYTALKPMTRASWSLNRNN